MIERESGDKVHIPVTDVRDIVACASTDLNTSVIALLNQQRINVHFLSYYGDYAGSLLTTDNGASGETVLAQARTASDPEASLEIARGIVDDTAFNVRRVIDRDLLAGPYHVLQNSIRQADGRDQLMGAEGTFRRSAWDVLDTRLPDWLQLAGRSRRSPRNAGNAFISYVNGIVYARVLTAVRLTPLHSGIAFLHTTMERHRHSLVLDLAEVFKPLFAERLLLRMAGRGQLKPNHFDTGSNQAMLSEVGRKLVVQTVRDELATTVQHRTLKRKVAYDELLYLEALRLTRHLLEGDPTNHSVSGGEMYVVVVYDTAAERNPQILRTCRHYLHHVQRSVFEGELSPAQLRRFQAAVHAVIDAGYDHVLVYTFPPGTVPQRHAWASLNQPYRHPVKITMCGDRQQYLQRHARRSRTTAGLLQNRPARPRWRRLRPAPLHWGPHRSLQGVATVPPGRAVSKLPAVLIAPYKGSQPAHRSRPAQSAHPVLIAPYEGSQHDDDGGIAVTRGVLIAPYEGSQQRQEAGDDLPWKSSSLPTRGRNMVASGVSS